MVDTGALVGAIELGQRVPPVLRAVVRLDDDVVDGVGVDALQLLRVGDVDDRAGDLGDDHLARVLSGGGLDPGADQRRLGDEQRHRLALHVGAHQGAVGVVMLEEGDEGGGHRDDLLRGHIHVLDVRGVGDDRLATDTAGHALGRERVVLVERRVRLRDPVHVLLVGGEVDDLVRRPGHDVDGLDAGLV